MKLFLFLPLLIAAQESVATEAVVQDEPEKFGPKYNLYDD
jgi:hypothetical protein